MTVSTQIRLINHSGNGVAVNFTYPFKITDVADIRVYLYIDSTWVLQTATTHYTVSGIGNPGGGTVTFVTPPSAGSGNVRLLRRVQLTQLVDYILNDDFPAEVHEGALDKLTMAIQDYCQESMTADQAAEFWDALGRRIVNAGDPIGLQDVVTKAWFLSQVLTGGGDAVLDRLADPDGASVIGFVQAGANAVTRDSQSKLRESVSVKDFGAVGDGVADDTSKIQAALDYLAGRSFGSAQGGRLYFPAGLYKISSALNVVDEMLIEGDGNESTKITTNSGYIFNVTSAGVRIQDIFFAGPYGAASNGIKFTNGNNCVVERCVFQNQTTGIELVSSYAVEVIGCIFDVCYTYGIRANTSCHNLSVERCGFFTCGATGSGHGVSIGAASDNIRIIGNDFEYCYVNMRLSNCTAVDISGNYCEYQAVRSFDLDGTCYGVKIEHNWIALGVGAGATETIKNVVGGSFKRNTIYNQSVTFDQSLLRGFTVGVNRKTGTGSLQAAPWITPTLLNSWVQQTNHTPVGYIMDEDGWVTLRGGLVGGTAPNTLFVLPAGYRPLAIAFFGTEGPNGACRITVNPDGTVVPVIAGGNNPFLDGIAFKVT